MSGASGDEAVLAALRAGHEKFLALVADVRVELHRYCARMTGSVADGEDIVQETLARAYLALSESPEVPPLRPWLFAMAHHRAIDHLRRYERRMGSSLAGMAQEPSDPTPDAEEALAREEALHAAISRFVELAPAQRSAVILKDVLGSSLEEIAALLGLTVPAVKAALHRGRERLRETAATPAEAPPVSPLIAKYAALFNARDWDGVRAMLADDVRLDLVSRSQRAGRRLVAMYFERYDAGHDWFLVPAWLEGREVLAVRPSADDERVTYFIELFFEGGRLALIRDYRYVPYIAADAAFSLPAKT